MTEPLVSVLTPVYDGEEYLAECIESVLAQGYRNWRYTIVNNCSTDRSGEIARSYASRDERIRVVDNAEFLGQVDNLNRAMELVDPASRWTKMVLADDWIFPACLEEMVRVGEAHPSVGIVGAWRQDQDRINCDALPGPEEFFDGREVARRCLVDQIFLAGSPNTLLYRSDVVRRRRPFYPTGTMHEDTEAFFEILADHDFGYVHQPLTFTRRENESLTSTIRLHDPEHRLDKLVTTVKYGPVFLGADEFARCRAREESAYYDFLGRRALWRLPDGFWAHQKRGLERVGMGLDRGRFVRSWLAALVRAVVDPATWRERVWHRISGRRDVAGKKGGSADGPAAGER